MTSIVNMVTFAWVEASEVFGWNWHMTKVKSMKSNSMVFSSYNDDFFIKRLGVLWQKEFEMRVNDNLRGS